MPDGSIRLYKTPHSSDTATLVDPEGRFRSTLEMARVHHLWTLHQASESPPEDFASDLYAALGRIGTKSSLPDASPDATMRNRWTTDLTLMSALIHAFQAPRELYSDLFNKHPETTQFYTLYQEDAKFGAQYDCHSFLWQGMSIANPEYEQDTMYKAFQHAVRSCHALRDTAPSGTVLILPDWHHAAYKHPLLVDSPYTQLLFTIPPKVSTFRPPDAHTGQAEALDLGTKWGINVYLVANPQALRNLDSDHIFSTLGCTLQTLCGSAAPPVSLATTPPTDWRLYDPAPPGQPLPQWHRPTRSTPPANNAPPQVPPLHLANLPRRYPDNGIFIYTDGSRDPEYPLGAAVVRPHPETENLPPEVINFQVDASPLRHTANRAELAAIAVALEPDEDIHLLTDSQSSQHMILNQARRPGKHTHHVHRALLEHIIQRLRDRQQAGLKTTIGKVAGHTGVKYNEAADTGAVTASREDRTTREAFVLGARDPLAHHHWPHTAAAPPPAPPHDHIHFPSLVPAPPAGPGVRPPDWEMADLKQQLRKHAAALPHTTLSAPTTHQRHIDTALAASVTLALPTADSGLTQRQRVFRTEFLWGVHNARLRAGLSKHTPFHCPNCGTYLSNGHLAGNCQRCPVLSGLRTDRHNSTLRMLLEALTTFQGGRWPLVAADCGTKPVRQFPKGNHEVDCTTPALPFQPATDPSRLADAAEGEDPDSLTVLPCRIPESVIHPDRLRDLSARVPDFCRVVGDPARPSHIQLGEFKYSTDYNTDTVEAIIHSKYATLRTRIQDRWPGATVTILPLIMTRTGSVPPVTRDSLLQLWSPDGPKPNRLPTQIKTLIANLQVHAVQWLELLLDTSRVRLRPRRR